MRRFLNLVVALGFCTTALISFSCEDEISDVGSGILDSGASANAFYVDLIAYNTNNDSIRSDEAVLQAATVGVYEGAVFGRTKARFISQARLSRLNPDFGTNPTMDSVILNIPVYYKNKDADVKVDTTYVYLTGNDTPSDTATILLKRTYKLDSIYGNTTAKMTLQVKEVAQYLYSQDSTYYSNRTLANCTSCENINDIEVLPNVLGTTELSNEVTTYQKIKKNETTAKAPDVVVQVKLDKEYFKQKFIDNQNSSDLKDQASFIRNLFRGIELSVLDNQGFLMNFNQNSAAFNLTMHYSYDNPNEDAEQERLNNTFPLTFGSYWSNTPGHNVQVNQFEHSNRSSQFVNAYTNPNTQQGDARLYLAGMDGTKTVIQLNEEQLSEMKNNVQNKGWAIVGAELTFHIDDTHGLKTPPYLFAWHNYKEEGKNKNKNFTDLVKFYNSYPLTVQFNPMYNYKNNPKTYTIRITDHIKNLVERNEVFEDSKIMVSLGNFLLSPSSSYSTVASPGLPFYNDRAFNPHRVVLHGSNSEQEDKKLKLKIYYTKNQL